MTLLWRRAIFDPDFKRIFCLVHGEKLSYSTCEESLRELNRLKQGKTGKSRVASFIITSTVGYRLVIICSNEQSISSHLITALHSYRRSNPDVSIPLLKEYLQSHLIQPNHIKIGASPNCTSTFNASSVDSNK